MAIKTILELKGLARSNIHYVNLVSKVSVNLGGPERPYSECITFLENFALEVGEDAVVDEMNHFIDQAGGIDKV